MDKLIPAWKKRPQTAGAMLLIRGYVETVTACDKCHLAMEDDEGIVAVEFCPGMAHYPCPHCGHANPRPYGRRASPDG